jgi:hypothetical protein
MIRATPSNPSVEIDIWARARATRTDVAKHAGRLGEFQLRGYLKRRTKERYAAPYKAMAISAEIA